MTEQTPTVEQQLAEALAALARVRESLNGAAMVPQAIIRRALDTDRSIDEAAEVLRYSRMTPGEVHAAKEALVQTYGRPTTVTRPSDSGLVYTFGGSKPAAEEAAVGNRGYYGYDSWTEWRQDHGWCVVCDFTRVESRG